MILVWPAVVMLAACGEKAPVITPVKKFVLSDTMQQMIKLDTVQQCNVTGELTLSGVVSFNDNNVVKIFPRSSGQVTGVRVSLGDKVRKGQVLATINSAEVAASFNDLGSANADLAIAKRQMDNAESLYKNGISSEREYTEAKQSYEKALAARNKVQASININGGGKANPGGEYTITAPIEGYIVEKKITTGAFIRTDMGDNLFTISDMKNVWVNANVFEADISKVAEGNEVDIRSLSYPDKTFKGTIDKISQVLDPQSKTMKVRVVLDNKDMLLKPDMFVRVHVYSSGSSQSMCVPAAALLAQDGRTYVVAYNGPEDIQIAEVTVLKSVGDKTFIKTELKPGQRVVTAHQLFIFNQLLNE